MMDHRYVIQADNEIILLKKFMDRQTVMSKLKEMASDDQLELLTNKIIYHAKEVLNRKKRYILGFQENKLTYVLKGN